MYGRCSGVFDLFLTANFFNQIHHYESNIYLHFQAYYGLFSCGG